jgi:membrane-bound lytic murein transglycosylase F
MKVSRAHGPWIVLLTGVLLLSCVSCDKDKRGVDEPPFIESGDLEDIERRGTLRILIPRGNRTAHLPRKGFSLAFEIDLAESYAHARDLEPVFVYVDSRDDLIPSLLDGKGDFVAANMTVTPERKRQVRFTVPLDVVREQLVTRGDEVEIGDAAGLAGRHVAVRRSSSYWNAIHALRERVPGIRVEEVPENVDTEEIIHRVATAWAVRPDSPLLLESLDEYITALKLTSRESRTSTADLAEIRQAKTLRVLTRNAAATYFLWRGQLMGFEYELAKEFTKREGLRLEMIAPSDGRDLMSLLVQGEGDLVAAALTPTERRREAGVAFSRPYNYVSQVVVARRHDLPIERVEDLAGRTFHVRGSSSYWDTLETLIAEGIPLELQAAPEELETEEIIARVAESLYDVTLADSNIVDIELNWRDDIRVALSIGEPVAQAWAVRDSNPELLEAVNAFLDAEYRGLFYNVTYARYFKNPTRIRTHVTDRARVTGGFSPYDELVRKYAEQYGFDWRLIVAVMYQESRFDPLAHSFAGARGLMQMLPRTADELGFEDLEDPETAIHAGIKYLDWLRDRFEPELAVRDRMWFTLAAYNAGAGHVRDARRLAVQQGRNPNRWFGNVESTMLLLSRSQYARNAQHGYCRCHEPVQYVREIKERYNAYVGTYARSLAE